MSSKECAILPWTLALAELIGVGVHGILLCISLGLIKKEERSPEVDILEKKVESASTGTQDA